MFRHFDGMAWPCPGKRTEELVRTLVYGEPTRNDLLLAAAVIEAYRQIFQDTEKQRRRVVREVRQGQTVTPNLNSATPKVRE